MLQGTPFKPHTKLSLIGVGGTGGSVTVNPPTHLGGPFGLPYQLVKLRMKRQTVMRCGRILQLDASLVPMLPWYRHVFERHCRHGSCCGNGNTFRRHSITPQRDVAQSPSLPGFSWTFGDDQEFSDLESRSGVMPARRDVMPTSCTLLILPSVCLSSEECQTEVCIHSGILVKSLKRGIQSLVLGAAVWTPSSLRSAGTPSTLT